MLIPMQAALSLSPGGVQALIPRQAAELVTPTLVCKGSPVSGLPAGDSSGFQGDLSLSQGGVQVLIPRQAALSFSPGGVQALIPRQAAELVTPPLVCKDSPVLELPAGDCSSGFQGDLSLNQRGVQVVQVLILRQAVLSLNPGGVQALIPRQAAELLTPPVVCKDSQVLGLPAGDSSGF